MKPVPPGGVPLLTAGDAARFLGVSMERFRDFEEDLGLVTPMSTQVGPRYREDELAELRDAIAPAAMYHTKLKPGEAARVLGVTTPTLRRWVELGRLHRDEQGLYDADEVHALDTRRRGRAAEPAGT